MREVYVDGWNRLTVQLEEGDNIFDAHILAGEWLRANGYPVYTLSLVPCGINKFREAD